jgi:cell division septum initiation protein DivIVA
VTSSAEASPAVTRLLQMATEQSERLVGEAQVEAQRIVSSARAEAESVIDNANKKSHETLTDARTRADRIESEARVNAEKVTNEAQQRADAVNGEADARRAELFTALEQERDTLRGKVDHLRSFESSFRTNMANHLQSQIKALTEAAIEPSDTPQILSEPAAESATPRLDALLSEGN